MVSALATAVVFATTNLDNMVILVGLLADRALPRRTVLIGHLSANMVIVAAAVAAALGAVVAPGSLTAWLGLGPITLGVLRLSSWRRVSAGPAAEVAAPAPHRGGQGLCVVGIMLASGADNLAAYIPVFARHSADDIGAVILEFSALSVAWWGVARALIGQPQAARALSMVSGRIAPLFLITLGARTLLGVG